MTTPPYAPAVLRGPPDRRDPARPLRRRRPLLVAHVGFSVGWIGLNTALLTLAVIGLATSDPATLRAVYVALGWLGLVLIAPFSVGTLITGLLVAIRGRWGLLQHWWVAVKLLIAVGLTIGSNLVLDLRLQSAANRVTSAQVAGLSGSSLGAARYVAVMLPIIECFLLLGALALSLYRPWGLTSFGARRRRTLQLKTGR